MATDVLCGAADIRSHVLPGHQFADAGARAAVSPGGTANPVTLSRTVSGIGPASLQTTGVPHAIASSNVRPRSSHLWSSFSGCGHRERWEGDHSRTSVSVYDLRITRVSDKAHIFSP